MHLIEFSTSLESALLILQQQIAHPGVCEFLCSTANFGGADPSIVISETPVDAELLTNVVERISWIGVALFIDATISENEFAAATVVSTDPSGNSYTAPDWFFIGKRFPDRTAPVITLKVELDPDLESEIESAYRQSGFGKFQEYLERALWRLTWLCTQVIKGWETSFQENPANLLGSTE